MFIFNNLSILQQMQYKDLFVYATSLTISFTIQFALSLRDCPGSSDKNVNTFTDHFDERNQGEYSFEAVIDITKQDIQAMINLQKKKLHFNCAIKMPSLLDIMMMMMMMKILVNSEEVIL